MLLLLQGKGKKTHFQIFCRNWGWGQSHDRVTWICLFSLYKYCRFGLGVCVPEIISTTRSICLTQGMGNWHDAKNSLKGDVAPLGLYLPDKSSSCTRRLTFPQFVADLSAHLRSTCIHLNKKETTIKPWPSTGVQMWDMPFTKTVFSNWGEELCHTESVSDSFLFPFIHPTPD